MDIVYLAGVSCYTNIVACEMGVARDTLLTVREYAQRKIPGARAGKGRIRQPHPILHQPNGLSFDSTNLIKACFV
jgi:hypothetical protein